MPFPWPWKISDIMEQARVGPASARLAASTDRGVSGSSVGRAPE